MTENAADALARLDPAHGEAGFQRAVIELAEMCGVARLPRQQREGADSSITRPWASLTSFWQGTAG